MDTLLSQEIPLLPFAEEVNHIPGFFLILSDVLSLDECDAIIQLCEEKEFSTASLHTDKDGVEHYSDLRKSQRRIVDSAPFAQTLWKRIQHHVPAIWGDSEEVIGLNERLRILKYMPGDEFKPHRDGNYISGEGHISRITLLIYLNEGYEGGFTHYYTHDGLWLGIPPKTGMVVLQDQNLYHCVPPLLKGCKYALRTEIMTRIPYNTANDKVVTLSST